ncbi:MAG TPA: response regulator [Vicinamibacterales bacterium]
MTRDSAAPRSSSRSEPAPAARLGGDAIGSIAHDLRSCLNTIVGWAELLRAGSLDEALRARAAGTIAAHARQLAESLDEAMDLWRVDAGALTAVPTSVDVSALLRNAMDRATPAARAAGVRWQIDTGPGGLEAWCDPARAAQALALLLAHAAESSPPHGVVTVTLSGGPAHVEITVRDEGPPLRPDALEVIFGEPPEGVPRGPASSTRGFDVRLLLARRLFELLGGSLVPIHDGGRAGFIVSLAHAPAPREAAVKGPLSGLRVLLVEDEPDAREALTSLLRLHGAEVISVGSVSEALAEARRHAPDLLLSDIAMPDRDGYELLRELRSLPRFARLPAAALTAFAGSADRQRALAAGFQIHLAKPVEPDHLLSAVQSLASAAAH